MSKIDSVKREFSQDAKVLSLINEIIAAMEPLATAVINSVKLPKIRRFRMSEAELVDFSEKLSHIEHEAHMAILRPVRALDEHLGFEWQTGCIVNADTDYLKSDFRGAVKDWALGLQGVSVTTLYA